MDKKQLSADSCQCEGCGSDMFYSPDDGCLVCPSCKGKKGITPNKKYNKNPLLALRKGDDDNKEWSEEKKVIKCGNCGAEVTIEGHQVSAQCPYCNTNLVLEQTEVDGLKPDAIVPFKFGKEKAAEIFKARINKNWFIPKKFKQSMTADNVEAYYFPAFAFDADSFSSYKGVLYDIERYTDSEGRSHTRRNHFPISGKSAMQHRNIEIEASTKLEQKELNWIRPYNLSEAVAYSNEYVSGYQLETYSSPIIDSYAQAVEIMTKDIRNNILSKYSYDGVSTLNVSTQYTNRMYSYCVLPMYRFGYTYKNKEYSNVMNGQTGALGGKTPKSGWKIAFTIILPIMLVLVPVLLAILLT